MKVYLCLALMLCSILLSVGWHQWRDTALLSNLITKLNITRAAAFSYLSGGQGRDNKSLTLADFQVSHSGEAATITFNTSVLATAQLEYGFTAKYGNTLPGGPVTKAHRFTLSGLIKNTVYHYRVIARDAFGNLATSEDMVLDVKPILSLTAPKPTVVADANVGMVGLIDKNQVLIPANYTTFTPPPVGGQYVDSVFGTTVTRLSDGWKTFKDGVHHEYATMSPFNRDNSMILLQGDNTGYFIVNRQGKILLRLDFSNSAEPRWSHHENDVFFYHDGNRMMKFNVTARRATVLETFPQFESIKFGGGGEGDISEDGDHLLICGDDRHVALYEFSTHKIGRFVDLHAFGQFSDVYITPANNILVRWEEDGDGKYQGISMHDRNFNYIRKFLTTGAHGDLTRDVNGDEVLVMGAYRETSPPPGCENNGVEKIRLSDSKKTCILPLHWYQEIHVSANTNGSHRWVLVSNTDGNGSAELPNKLPADWHKRWRVRGGELILVKVDGSEVRRIVHHRGRVAEYYWWQPRATLSKDGKFAIFDSNFGFNPIKDYTDAYLVNLQP